MDARAHEYVGLIEIMPLEPLYMASELYFVIFAAFKESITLNLPIRGHSKKVIYFGGNQKPVYTL